MNAIGYLRGSDGYSLDEQDRIIREYAQENNICIMNCVVDTGEDRVALDNLAYGVIGNPPVQAVITARSDRVSGDANMFYYYKMCLLKKGVNLIAIDYQFSLEHLNVLEGFVVTVAEMERDYINKRKFDGKLEKALRGGWSGGKPPYGYDAIRGSGKLIVNPTEKEMVLRIFDLNDRLALPYRAICDVLKKEGYKTRQGKEIQASTVGNIIGNRKLYQGYIKHHGAWIEGQHEKILK